MPNKPPALLEEAELARLLQRAIDALDSYDPGDPEDDRWDEETQAALSSLRESAMCAIALCASQARQRRLVSCLPALLEGFELVEPWEEHFIVELVADGIGALGALALSSPEGRAMATSPSADVRRALAEHLTPNAPDAIEVLQTLAQDPDRRVREEARKSLGPDLAPQWWTGLFVADPVARLGKGEAQRAAPALGRLKKLAEQRWFQVRKDEDKELTAIVRALPDVLAVELAESHLKRPRIRFASGAVAAEMLKRPGAVEAFTRVITHQVERNEAHAYDLDTLVESAAKGVPDQQRIHVALALARIACKAPWHERSDHDADLVPWARVAGKLWPPRADPTPMIDLILGMEQPEEEPEPGTVDWVANGLSDNLKPTAKVLAPLFPRLFEAQLAGARGPWRPLRSDLRTWLDLAPVKMLREAALKGVRSDDPDVCQWALEQLLGRAHRPREDGQPLETVERFWSMPRTRAAMLDHHALRWKSVVPLRRALREGTLDLEGAAAALSAIDHVYGGMAHGVAFGVREPERAEAERGEHRKELKAYLGPRALHGPITDEEWRIYRSLRDAAMRAGTVTTWRNVLTHFPVVPEGPWDPSDFAVIEHALAAPKKEPMCIAMALCINARVEHFPLWERLLAETPDPDDRRWVRGARKHVHEALGIEPPARTAAQEQDDEDEDDGWDDEADA